MASRQQVAMWTRLVLMWGVLSAWTVHAQGTDISKAEAYQVPSIVGVL